MDATTDVKDIKSFMEAKKLGSRGHRPDIGNREKQIISLSLKSEHTCSELLFGEHLFTQTLSDPPNSAIY